MFVLAVELPVNRELDTLCNNPFLEITNLRVCYMYTYCLFRILLVPNKQNFRENINVVSLKLYFKFCPLIYSKLCRVCVQRRVYIC